MVPLILKYITNNKIVSVIIPLNKRSIKTQNAGKRYSPTRRFLNELLSIYYFPSFVFTKQDKIPCIYIWREIFQNSHYIYSFIRANLKILISLIHEALWTWYFRTRIKMICLLNHQPPASSSWPILTLYMYIYMYYATNHNKTRQVCEFNIGLIILTCRDCWQT
jgi:hypothetical protein